MLAVVLRVDIGRMAGIKTTIADAGTLMDWITNMIRNFELAAIWLIIWPCLHLGTLFATRFTQVSPRVWIIVEILPGFMLALALVRLSISFVQFNRVSLAIGEARQRGGPPPAWSQRPGILLRLATPTDLDFLLLAALIAAIQLQVR